MKPLKATAGYRIEVKERHLDAVELDANVPMCLSVSDKVNLSKVKRAKIYVTLLKL